MNPGFEEIISIRGRSMPEDGEVTITGHDPVYNGDERPKLLPASACDYTTGYNGAYGVLLALARRARSIQTL